MAVMDDSRVRQVFTALERADDIRMRRRELKARLKVREVAVLDVVREPEWWLFTARVCDVLAWAPKVGPTRVNKVLRRADVWPLRQMGALTMRQRLRIITELETLDVAVAA